MPPSNAELRSSRVYTGPVKRSKMPDADWQDLLDHLEKSRAVSQPPQNESEVSLDWRQHLTSKDWRLFLNLPPSEIQKLKAMAEFRQAVAALFAELLSQEKNPYLKSSGMTEAWNFKDSVLGKGIDLGDAARKIFLEKLREGQSDEAIEIEQKMNCTFHGMRSEIKNIVMHHFVQGHGAAFDELRTRYLLGEDLSGSFAVAAMFN